MKTPKINQTASSASAPPPCYPLSSFGAGKRGSSRVEPVMPFKQSCVQLRNDPATSPLDREILDYLLRNALGRKNVKSWRQIAEFLEEKGVVTPTKENFQRSLLSKTRRSDSYIGSNMKGYFIIDSIEDAFSCLSFYIKRITEEQSRVENLRQLMNQAYIDNSED